MSVLAWISVFFFFFFFFLLQHGRNCLQLAVLHGHLDTALAVLQTKLMDINSANKVMQYGYHII